MAKTLDEWNRHLSRVKDLRDLIKEGTKTTNGLDVRLSMADCDTLWHVLNDEIVRVTSRRLDYTTEEKNE